MLALGSQTLFCRESSCWAPKAFKTCNSFPFTWAGPSSSTWDLQAFHCLRYLTGSEPKPCLLASWYVPPLGHGTWIFPSFHLNFTYPITQLKDYNAEILARFPHPHISPNMSPYFSIIYQKPGTRHVIPRCTYIRIIWIKPRPKWRWMESKAWDSALQQAL